MANGKGRSIFTKDDIHSDKVFIASLMKGIPNKHTRLSLRGKFGLIKAKAMNIGCTPKHIKRNLRSEAGRGIRLLKTI